MKHTLLSTTLFLLATFISINPIVAQLGGVGGAGNLVITEIMYNPPEAGTDSLEFIEILNSNAAAVVNMTGIYFSSGIQFTFPDAFMLGAGERVVIAKDSIAFEGVFGFEVMEWETLSLLNSGEGIALRNASGAVLDTVFYDDNSPWPAEADGGGYSLVLCDPTMDNNDPANWSAAENNTGVVVNSLTIFADPGAAPTCTPVGISNTEKDDAFSLYPNPNNGQFEMRLNKIEKDITIELFDVSGKIVHLQNVKAGYEGILRFDLQLDKGIYILRAGKNVSRLMVSE